MPRTPATHPVPWFRPSAWLASIGVHLLAGVVAASWLLPAREASPRLGLDSRWKADASEAEPLLESPALDVPPVVINPGGPSWNAADALLPADVLTDPASLPIDTPRSSPAATEPDRSTLSATTSTESSGTAAALGQGPGNQPGFFGMQPPQGQRVIFVVDNSRSMNHPHDSPAKTRLRRLKIELVKCILEMTPEQQFYVIFFSNETTPMPASGLPLAQPGVREPYLRWIAQLPSSGGPTNPLPALELALRMQPDTICFLTDGDFDKRVKRILMSLEQQRTSIHTFAFGEITAEETLKTLAEHNRGEYRFVP